MTNRVISLLMFLCLMAIISTLVSAKEYFMVKGPPVNWIEYCDARYISESERDEWGCFEPCPTGTSISKDKRCMLNDFTLKKVTNSDKNCEPGTFWNNRGNEKEKGCYSKKCPANYVFEKGNCYAEDVVKDLKTCVCPKDTEFDGDRQMCIGKANCPEGSAPGTRNPDICLDPNRDKEATAQQKQKQSCENPFTPWFKYVSNNNRKYCQYQKPRGEAQRKPKCKS